jgi:hypothetical protein
MASRRAAVFIAGILRGESHERQCNVRAIKVTMTTDPMIFEYVDLKIDGDNFPDGNYEASIAGRTY